jgi:hypothetical protein
MIRIEIAAGLPRGHALNYLVEKERYGRPLHQAKCVCGYRTPGYPSQEDAFNGINAHLVAEYRASLKAGTISWSVRLGATTVESRLMPLSKFDAKRAEDALMAGPTLRLLSHDVPW